MRIAFDATSLARPQTGIETYARHLLAALLREKSPHAWVVLLRGGMPEELRELAQRGRWLNCPANSQLFCEQVWIPRVLAKERVDLAHFPAFPPSPLVSVPFIYTAFDATLWRNWPLLSWKGKFYFRPLADLALRRARKVLTISESSRRDLQSFFPGLNGTVANAGIGISEDFFTSRRLTRSDAEAVRRRYRLPQRFILSVGSLEPRKNLKTLLWAFARYGELHPADKLSLVLAGRPAWGAAEVAGLQKHPALRNRLVFTGYVPQVDLPKIYRLATMLVFPSRYEGFGLPVAEAFASGTPVVASQIPAVVEQADGAALLVDPFDVEGFAQAMARLSADGKLRRRFAAQGRAAAARYRWQKVAEQVLAIYAEVGQCRKK